MAYLIIQIILYLLGAFLLGLALGWGLWGRLGRALNTTRTEQEPLRAEIERLKTSLEACGRAYADLEKKQGRHTTSDEAKVTELEPVNLLAPHIDAKPVEVVVEPVTPVEPVDPDATVPPITQAKSRRKAPAAKIDPVMESEDLSRIVGIGPENAKRLNAAYVSTFAQIANWTADDIERIEDILGFHGRVERERWIEQAKLLAAGDEEEFARRFPTANKASNT